VNGCPNPNRGMTVDGCPNLKFSFFSGVQHDRGRVLRLGIHPHAESDFTQSLPL